MNQKTGYAIEFKIVSVFPLRKEKSLTNISVTVIELIPGLGIRWFGNEQYFIIFACVVLRYPILSRVEG
jgi:hypothetical protein